LSYRRASVAAPTSGATPVTVCTNDLALCNLVEHAPPITISQPLRDAEFLVPKVVELQDDRVALAAIDARVLTQVGDQKGRSFGDLNALSALGLVDVATSIGLVVLPLVAGPTRPAVAVPLPTLPSTPRELVLLLRLPAPTAPSHLRNLLSQADIPESDAELDRTAERDIALTIRQNAGDPTGSGAVW
jgi:hypothetical protein